MSFMREYAEWNDFWWEKAGDFDCRRVLLIGDSITRSYRDRVQERLRPLRIAADKLCGSRCAGDPMLEAELSLSTGPLNGYRYEAIHFNNGLHGVCNDTLIPLDVYCDGVRRIVEILRQNQPQAKIVIATSTPISVRGTNDISRLDPDNETILARNAFLRRFAKEEGLLLDDLYGLVTADASFAKTDYVHFEKSAAVRLGDRVADLLLTALGEG